jgi:hypothetical protein
MTVQGAPAVLVAAFHATGGKIDFKQNLAVNTWRGTERPRQQQERKQIP